MSSTSEKGYAKTVGNFEDLISACNGFGSKYVPSRKALETANLQTLHQSAVAAIKDVSTAKAAKIIAVNQRQLVFEPIKSLATKVINALIACAADKKMVADARTINRKLQGVRAPKAAPPPPTNEPAADESEKKISASQQSFDSLQAHFGDLLELILKEGKYKPNEAELQTASLSSSFSNLQTSNTNVINANTELSNKRINRDTVLYAEPDSLVDIALAVKVYVKSVFTVKSPQYKQISKLQFPKRKKD